VVEDKVYVMGGKKLPSHIFNNVWMLDLKTLIWSLIFTTEPPNDTTLIEGTVIPEPRYFHTACNYKNQSIIVFGGLGPPEEEAKGERCLDDLAIFDLSTRKWRIPQSGTQAPPARYAHVAAISRDRLVITGGELRFVGKRSYENLSDMHVFDIPTEKWVYQRALGAVDDHIGYYRSVMVTAPFNPSDYPVDNREEEDRLLDAADALYQQIPSSKLTSEPSSPTSFRSRSGSLETPTHTGEERRPSRGNLNIIPETESKDSEPYIYVYSTRQRTARELARLLMRIHSPQSDNFAVEDFSNALPPREGTYVPLRFPSGDIVGDWLLYSGTVPNEKPTEGPGRPPQPPGTLKPASFHILAINLSTKQSKVIDVGSVFLTGSWNRGIVSTQLNSVIVFGNAGLDMTADYTMRRANFNHVVMVDLHVFGIYTSPKITTGTFARDFALNILSRKEFSDMDVVTKDNYRIHVNSRILAHRWPMFTEVLNTCIYGTPNAGEKARRTSVSSATLVPQNLHPLLPITERPRVLYLPLKQEHAIVFLSYIYTNSLPEEVDVPTLCALLALSKRFAPGLDRLAELVSDELHRQLNEGNVWPTIEAAAFSGQTGLQIKAMLVMRTAVDLKIQAQRRRLELQSKESPTISGNGETNGMANSVTTVAVKSEVGSSGSNQSADGVISPAIEGKSEASLL
jgi:hypothetical protein